MSICRIHTTHKNVFHWPTKRRHSHPLAVEPGTSIAIGLPYIYSLHDMILSRLVMFFAPRACIHFISHLANDNFAYYIAQQAGILQYNNWSGLLLVRQQIIYEYYLKINCILLKFRIYLYRYILSILPFTLLHFAILVTYQVLRYSLL